MIRTADINAALGSAAREVDYLPGTWKKPIEQERILALQKLKELRLQSRRPPQPAKVARPVPLRITTHQEWCTLMAWIFFQVSDPIQILDWLISELERTSIDPGLVCQYGDFWAWDEDRGYVLVHLPEGGPSGLEGVWWKK